MRNTFADTLTGCAAKDRKLMLLTGDLGFSVLERFRDSFPDRFLNMGISEANMIGAASGLALGGMKPYVYSIIPFATMRCFEQVRNDVCYQDADVKIVGVGGGLAYGTLGPTHHAREDIALMTSLPNMTVVCPGDPIETELLTKLSVSHQGPMYIRLGRGGDPVIHQSRPDVEIGKGIMVKEGNDATIIATGNILPNALAATKILEEKKMKVRLISMHTVKPLDADIIRKAAKETDALFTVEEHSAINGLGSAVGDALHAQGSKAMFRKIGLKDRFEQVVGNHEYLRQANGLSPEQISSAVLEARKTLRK